jgi:thiosulfate dehydrogenase [quinone] large subunit
MKKENIVWFLLRITMGWIFLWAFLDKLFGFGFSTKMGWLAGGNPTGYYLSKVVTGPFSGIFHGIAGTPIVNLLFMLGLLGLGIALILGIGMSIAAYGGAVLVFLLWLTELPKVNNPFIDEHIVYLFVLLLLSWNHAGEYGGLGKWWNSLSFVKKNKWLQ